MDARNMYVHAVRHFPVTDIEAINGKVEKDKFYTIGELRQLQREYDESKESKEKSRD